MAKTIQLRPIAPAAISSVPLVLVVAGSDSLGGAGIEADIKTLSAHKVYGCTCITALTVQNTQGVRSVCETPAETVRGILDTVLDDFGRGTVAAKSQLRAVKTGMLTAAALAELKLVRLELNRAGFKLIVDPVMVSTSGARLMSEESMAAYLELISGAFLVTPNYVEAVELAKAVGLEDATRTIKSVDDGIQFVRNLRSALGCGSLLVKGGHLPDFEQASRKIYDFLDEDGTVTVFESHYIDSKDNHGSGCTLASAITAQIALGKLLQEAVPLSLDFIHQAMSNFAKLGKGNGPLNHTVVPAASLDRVVTSTKVPVSEIIGDKSLYEYLKLHPRVQDGWKRYTRHPFLKLLATNQLPFARFLYYLKQDYYYLVNYAQMHGLAAGVAPTYKQTRAQADIIQSVVEEIERHKQKLCSKYDIDYEKDQDLDIELQPGPACLAYCDYLIKVSQQEDFLGIKISLAPCLHGYYEAGIYGKDIRDNYQSGLGILEEESESAVYDQWLGDYGSEWYSEAHKEGIDAIEALVKDKNISRERMEELVTLFAKVVDLEIGFWDEVVGEQE